MGGFKKALEGTRTYGFTLRTWEPGTIAGIVVPSQRLLDAATQGVSKYPLMLRLDTTIVPGLDTLITAPFHFRSAAGIPVPFQIEHIDTLHHKADIWCRCPLSIRLIVNNSK